METTITADQGERADIPGLGNLEHTIAPRTLAAPTHVHQNEDEYSRSGAGRYALTMDMSTIGSLVERHGLQG
jgi:hypothetical protein